MTDWSDPDTARKILTEYRTFAVVGSSSSRGRPSNGVTRYLMNNGYNVIPVNPNHDEVHGLKCYPDLASVPEDVEVVDLFRRSSEVAVHVDEAIAIGAKAIWMQLGVIDEAAAQKAAEAGLDVVMDRCPAIDHPQMIGSARS